MTNTMTASTTFTITDARYVASKLGADLGYLRAVYGCPVQTKIDDYVEEVAQLLKAGYLDTVDYGFMDSNDVWKLRLRYRATVGGHLIDVSPGGIRSVINTTGLSFHSFLRFSNSWLTLPRPQQETFEKTLPFVRTFGNEPKVGNGTTTTGTGYGRNGTGVSRDLYIDLS